MALNLSVIKSPAGATLATTEKTFAEHGGTIGRGDSNDWVLDDPERFLSSKHCSLSFEGGQYYLTDTSTNGTFINSAPEPLGKGGKIPVNDGDTIEIGDYQFRAQLQSGLGVGGSQDMLAGGGDPFTSSPPPSDFGAGGSAGASQGFGPSDANPPVANSPNNADPFASDPFASDPFGTGSAGTGSTSAQPVDPFSSDPFPGGFANDSQDSGSGAFGGGSDGFGGDAMIGGVSLTPDSKNVDPLAALDSMGGGQAGSGGASVPVRDPIQNPIQDPMGLSGSPSLESQDPLASNDFFAPNHPPGHDAFGAKNAATHSDGSGALNQSVDWPEPKNEGLIPEGWDDDLLGGAALGAVEAVGDKDGDKDGDKSDDGFLSGGGAPPLEDAPVKPSSQPVRPGGGQPAAGSGIVSEPVAGGNSFPGAAGLTVGDEHRSLPLTDPPKRRPVPPAEFNEPLLEERRPERAPSFLDDQAPKNKDSSQVFGGADAEAGGKAASPVANTNRQKVAQAAGEALLEGMGLNNKNLSEKDVELIYASVGELMPVVVDGMMQVLRSRASIKNEFRMNVTTIQPVENNPLKFSADANEAIDNMFVRKSGAYMGAKEAFQEGFDGVGEHQVAIIAGIRAGFESMMERFNPELLEKQFDRQGKGVSLPGMQKAKYWNSYMEHYKGFVDNMENTFQYLFGDEFVQAYEEQLRRLAVERKKNRKLDS